MQDPDETDLIVRVTAHFPTPPRGHRRLPLFCTAILLLAGMPAFQSLAIEPLEPPGFKALPVENQAIIGATLMIRPGAYLSNATLLIRGERIVSVTTGTTTNLPAGTRSRTATGKVIYPGFIEPYACLPAPPPLRLDRASQSEAGTGTSHLTSGGPRFLGAPGEESDPGQPGPGSSVSGVTPERRMALSPLPDEKAIAKYREQGFVAANLVPTKGILRGSGTLLLLDGQDPSRSLLRPDALQHIVLDPGATDRPNAFPTSLMGAIAVVRQALLDGQWRASNAITGLTQVSGPPPRFDPSLDALASLVRGTQSVCFEPGGVVMLERIGRLSREWKLKAIAVASGQEWRRPDLLRAAGLSLIVPIDFPEPPKLPTDAWETLDLDLLRAWDWAPENPVLLRREGVDIALTTHGLGDLNAFRAQVRKALERGLGEADALAALTVVPAKFLGASDDLGTLEAGKLASFTVVESGPIFAEGSKISAVWISGREFPSPIDTTEPTPSKPPQTNAPPDELKQLRQQRIARAPWDGALPTSKGSSVLVQNATIWTSGPGGTLTNADLLVVNGKVEQVGRKLSPAPGTVVVDGTGHHLTPGIVDAHNHWMILGAVNEVGLPSTAMVRVEDVINSESPNIHLELAGGVTTVNLLHGSANPIGGQNAIIKLKEGAAPADLRVANAIPGIKFALGENVKQAGGTSRYPQTRMGVPVFIANRFLAASRYREAQDAFRTGKGPQPRPDLELEALADILDGKRVIHCHSYRQDEILAFLRTMEGFQVKVATLQHVLEGYKVADEIARHGAGASTFSDWWAYKYEVIDAIPYNGALMHDRGVVVSFNSDDPDLARRLNLEAGKAVKYGNLSEVEALKFVTSNPAQQLGLEGRIGRLEPGADGDFAIWSGNPLDAHSLCLETWIEGRKYFDRAHDLGRRPSLQKERADLLAKARKLSGQKDAPPAAPALQAKFFIQSMERATRTTVHCLEVTE